MMTDSSDDEEHFEELDNTSWPTTTTESATNDVKITTVKLVAFKETSRLFLNDNWRNINRNIRDGDGILITDESLLHREIYARLINSLMSNHQDVDKYAYAQACQILNDLRLSGKLCDATIRVNDGTEFLVHRVVMCASSVYFIALFTNGLCDKSNKYTLINIGGIDSDLMRTLIEWAYTRQVDINEQNVERLLPAADQFQFLDLVSKCCDFLVDNLAPENVIGFRKFAAIYICQRLKQATHDYLTKNFILVASRSREFLELTKHELIEIITDDELNLRDESILFDVILKWISYDQKNRTSDLLQLLRCIRIGFLPMQFMIGVIRSHPLVIQLATIDAELREFLLDSANLISSEASKDSYQFIDFSDYRKRPRVPHDLLVVVGGWSNGVPTSSIEIYDSRANMWHFFDLIDHAPRAYHGCLMLGEYIYAIGGYDDTTYFNNCRRYCLKSKEWQEVAPMHSKRCYVSVAEVDGVIYAMGGFDGVVRLSSAEKYTPATNQWSLISPMNANRSDASAAALNGKVYICGGFDGQDCISTAEFYDPQTGVWTLITPMSTRRSGVGVVAYRGHVYAIGGYNGMNRLNSGEKYNPTTRRWTPIKSMQTPRSNYAIDVIENKIYAIGGFDGVRTVSTVECYDSEGDEWVEKQNMNLNRSALAACVVSGIDFTRQYSTMSVQLRLFRSPSS